jgi:hypothetical protein
MKTTNRILLVGLCLIFGSMAMACASLNENTEGHIISALEGKKDAFKACYETALEKNREEQGMVKLKLDINEEPGEVTSSEVEETTIKDADMPQCVADAASDITLPEPPGVPVEGHYDIDFGFE